jgi:hypothetical protein
MPQKLLTRLFTCALTITCCTAAFAQYAGSIPVDGEARKGFDDISAAECRPWLTYLSGPECEGRGSGQPGYLRAAGYMAKQFKKYGLKPMGDNGYFQEVPFVRTRVAQTSRLEVGKLAFHEGKDVSLRLPDKTDVSGNLVFVNAKGAEAKLGDNLKVEGKIVIFASDPKVPGRVRFGLFQLKPAAVLFVSNKISATQWNAGPAGRNSRFSFVSGSISEQAAQALTQTAGISKDLLDTSSGETAVKVADTQASAHLIGNVEKENIGVPNVVGLLEGSDPALKNEFVGVGAHLDHLGKQGTVVYPGADDDGSGTTALIAIMKAYADSHTRPKRSILFMNFCGEELGLIGSGYLANHPMVPLNKMVCELQMDMVGRNSETKTDKPQDNVDTIRLVGSKRISTELHNLILEENKHVNFQFKYDEEAVYTRSDHYNFAAKGVPIAFLFDGFHPDYHQPTDTVDKINFDKIANTAKLYYLVSLAAANRPEPFKHDVGSTQ